MGCGASVPKPATAAQQKEMCTYAARKMECICANAAFEKSKDIKCTPPPALQKIEDNAKKMKEEAGKIKEETSEAPSGGGMMGSMMGAAKAAAGAIASGGLSVVADSLDTAFDNVRQPFDTVAQDVIAKKKGEMVTCFINVINGFEFTDPVKICRGDGATDRISNSMMELAQDKIIQALMPIVKEEIKDHLITKGWDAAVNKYNTAYDAISKFVKLDGMGIQREDTDLPTYIAEDICKSIAKIMATEETATRASPADKDTEKPGTFVAVFSSDELMDTPHYSDFKK